MRRICVIFFNKNKDVDLTTKELQSHDECYQTFTRGFSVAFREGQLVVPEEQATQVEPQEEGCYESLKNYVAGLELTFQRCIVKNTCEILLVLVSPKCTPWLSQRDRKCRNFACYMLKIAGKSIFQCKLKYLVKATLQSDLKMKNVFRVGKT